MLKHSAQKLKSVHPEPGWKIILECAAVEVFELTAGVRLGVMSAPLGEPCGDCTAMVGMAGALCGMATIRCSRAIAANLASHMLGGDAPSSSRTVGDALGELCNMVAGNFKSKIGTLANQCMLSVPTVLSGEDYCMQPVDPSESFQVALDYQGVPIWVSLVVHT
jgi:chemotaxis protein CheX